MKKKKIPIGISDFRKMIEGDYYYVDKSLLIKEILDSGTENSLITRPRRFGKTLNLSMLKCFFEAKFPGDARSPTEECSPSISKGLFQHLKIWQEGEEYTEHCGKYPVIFLTFKNLKEPSWDECYVKIKETISPYKAKASPKMRIRNMQTKILSCCAFALTPASPTIPIANPAA